MYWGERKLFSAYNMTRPYNLLPHDITKPKSTNEFKIKLDLCTKNRSLVAAKHGPKDVTSDLKKSLKCKLWKFDRCMRIRTALSKP